MTSFPIRPILIVGIRLMNNLVSIKKISDIWIILIAAGIGLALLAPFRIAAAEASSPEFEGSQNKQKKLSAKSLASLQPERSVFKVIRGKGKGRRIKMTMEPLPDAEGRYRLTFEGLYRLYISRKPDGSVHGSCLELIEKNKRIRFKPDLELIPSTMATDQRIRATGCAALYDLESGEETNTGSYLYVIEGLSRTTLETPAGTIKGHLFEYSFQIDLKYSKVILDLENGWSENRKLVYWRTKTKVEKLGLFGETTFRSMALLKKEPE